MKPFNYLFAVAIVATTAGCSAIDLTQDHTGETPRCPIHHIEMHRERIQVAGERVYVLEYSELARRTFPNHGGHRYNFETDDTPWNRDVVDWVCPECHREYLAYWKNRTSSMRLRLDSLNATGEPRRSVTGGLKGVMP